MHLRGNQTIVDSYGWIPSTDQLVIIGFLIILITEQIIHGIGHSIGNGHSHSGHSPLATSDSIKMNKFHDVSFCFLNFPGLIFKKSFQEEEGEDHVPLVAMDDDADEIIFRQVHTLKIRKSIKSYICFILLKPQKWSKEPNFRKNLKLCQIFRVVANGNCFYKKNIVLFCISLSWIKEKKLHSRTKTK